MRIGQSGTWLVFAATLGALGCLESAGGESAGEGSRVLAESDFLWDVDGWTLHGNDAGLQHGSKMIKGADNDTSIWYFVAPSKFLGAQRAAYGGKLSFRHGFFEYNSDGLDFLGKEFDVLLKSEANDMVIARKNVIPPWSFRSDHELELVETAGWVVEGAGVPPSKPDMQRVLARLSAVWIRGGFYAGNEDSYLTNVRLTAGPENKTPPRSSLREQRILSAEGFQARTPAADSPVPLAPESEPREDAPPPPQEVVKDEL